MSHLVDLHLHTSFSDGVFSPQQVVTMAAEAGMKAVAIADHDTVRGVDAALAAGMAAGIEVLPAVELSVEFKGYRDVHLLGYCLDHHDPELLEKLEGFAQRRAHRGAAIVEKLNERLKLEGKQAVCEKEVAALAEGSLGRPHIAQILMRKGVVKDMQEAFVRYLIPCDVPKRYFPIAEAISLIRRTGGVAVLAHPMHISREYSEITAVLNALTAMGLDGIEAHHNGATAQDTSFMAAAARKRGLIVTGGSDFHGIEEGVLIGAGRGELEVPYLCVEELKRVHRERKESLLATEEREVCAAC